MNREKTTGIPPFLSIIVPVFNAQEFLEQCIQSIICQKFKDFELLLIDDGSTDKSLEICNVFQEKDNRVRVEHIENAGAQNARNYGVNISKGRYIGFVDADDFLSPEFYQQVCFQAKERNVDIVISDFCNYSEDHIEKMEQVFDGGLYNRLQIEEEILPRYICNQRYFEFGFLPALWNKIYRAELIKKFIEIPDYTIRIGEDAAVFYPFMLVSSSLYYVKGEYGYFYRNLTNSASKMITSNDLASAIVLADVLWERMSFEFMNQKISSQFFVYIIYMITQAISKNWLYFRKKDNIRYFTNIIKTKKWYTSKWRKSTHIRLPVQIVWTMKFLGANTHIYKLLLDSYFLLNKTYYKIRMKR